MKKTLKFVFVVFVIINIILIIKYRVARLDLEVLAVRGNCSVYNQNISRNLKSGYHPITNSTIVTKRGSAIISLPDGRLKIDKRSKLKIIRYSKWSNSLSTNIRLRLVSGAVVSYINPKGFIKNKVSILTSNGVMGIRGTIFRISTYGNKTKVTVKKGTVDFKTSSGKNYSISDKKGLFIDSTKIAVKFDLTEKDKYEFERFFLENSVIQNKTPESLLKSVLSDWTSLSESIRNKIKMKKNPTTNKKITDKINKSASFTEMNLIKKALSNYYLLNNSFPLRLETLRDSGYYENDGFLYDAWTRRYIYNRTSDGFELRSAGEDGEYNTSDDIVVK